MSLNQMRLHFQNMIFGIGKAVTEYNMSQNQIVTKYIYAYTMEQGSNNHKIQCVRESDKAALPEYDIWNR